MLLYLVSALFAYLIHRFVSGNKVYLYPPLAGLLNAGLTTLLVAYIFEKWIGAEINDKQLMVSIGQNTILATFFTYLNLWIFRREAKKKQEKEKSNN